MMSLSAFICELNIFSVIFHYCYACLCKFVYRHLTLLLDTLSILFNLPCFFILLLLLYIMVIFNVLHYPFLLTLPLLLFIEFSLFFLIHLFVLKMLGFKLLSFPILESLLLLLVRFFIHFFRVSLSFKSGNLIFWFKLRFDKLDSLLVNGSELDRPMLFFLINVREDVMVLKIGGAFVKLATLVFMFSLSILILSNYLKQICFLLLLELLGLLVLFLESLDVFYSLLGLSFHSLFFLGELLLVLLLKQLSLVVGTTFQVSHFLHCFVMVYVVNITRINSYCVKLINICTLHCVLLSSFNFHLFSLLVLDCFILKELFTFCLLFALFVLDKIALNNLVPGFL